MTTSKPVTKPAFKAAVKQALKGYTPRLRFTQGQVSAARRQKAGP